MRLTCLEGEERLKNPESYPHCHRQEALFISRRTSSQAGRVAFFEGKAHSGSGISRSQRGGYVAKRVVLASLCPTTGQCSCSITFEQLSTRD